MHKPITRGCTVVEILVAIALFGIGVLALASSSAVVVRRLYAARANTAAAAITASRFAQIGAARCGGAASGSSTHPVGVTESWASSSAGTGLVRVHVTLLFTRSGKTSDFESVVACK